MRQQRFVLARDATARANVSLLPNEYVHVFRRVVVLARCIGAPCTFDTSIHLNHRKSKSRQSTASSHRRRVERHLS
jgi:hypothetical protein